MIEKYMLSKSFVDAIINIPSCVKNFRSMLLVSGTSFSSISIQFDELCSHISSLSEFDHWIFEVNRLHFIMKSLDVSLESVQAYYENSKVGGNFMMNLFSKAPNISGVHDRWKRQVSLNIADLSSFVNNMSYIDQRYDHINQKPDWAYKYIKYKMDIDNHFSKFYKCGKESERISVASDLFDDIDKMFSYNKTSIVVIHDIIIKNFEILVEHMKKLKV